MRITSILVIIWIVAIWGGVMGALGDFDSAVLLLSIAVFSFLTLVKCFERFKQKGELKK